MTVAPRMLAEDSREIAFACDRHGNVTWADDRAERLLGLRAGARLADHAVAGADEKLERLVSLAAAERLSGWEVPLLVGGRPSTVHFRARPYEDGALLLGSLVPEEYASMMSQVGEAMNEIVDLNRQITKQKRELEAQREELLRLNHALEDSTKGVMTLHAELEDRADALRRSSEVRGRVVANVSHEFRTPLHTILGLSKLLLDESDGPLNEEQAKQVRFVRTSAEELSQLVNDLLDLSKLESGKMNLRVESFTAHDFLAAMRGMLRPIVATESAVDFVVEIPEAEIRLETDRAKISQVMRNLVSNALKFTEQGSVKLSVRDLGDGRLSFEVQDSGIGIAEADLERVFEEFSQIESAQQRKVKGTGLGLPLSRKLAELLGGYLTVESELGKGSTFRLVVPALLPEVAELQQLKERSRHLGPGQSPVLVVEDDRKTIFLYERYLASAGFRVVPARTIDEARGALATMRPAAIVLDIMLEGETSWDFLADVKRDPRTADVPVLVVTVTNKEQKARALGADEFWLKPMDQDRLLRKLRTVAPPGENPRILIVDDDDKSRYLLRKYLMGTPYAVLEAASGHEGVKLARDRKPHVIFLDFLLREGTAFDVLDELKSDPRTRGIPVIVNTSHTLDETEKERLAKFTEAILSKESLSRELALSRIRDALAKAGVSSVARGKE